MFKQVNPALLPESWFMISALCAFKRLSSSVLKLLPTSSSWYRRSVRTATPIRCAVKRMKSNLFQVAKSRLKISNTSTISRELLFETKLVIAISAVGTGKRNWWWGSHQDQKTSKTNNQTWACLSDTIVSSNITLLYCLNSALSGELIRLFVKVGKAQRFKRCIYMGTIFTNRTTPTPSFPGTEY